MDSLCLVELRLQRRDLRRRRRGRCFHGSVPPPARLLGGEARSLGGSGGSSCFLRCQRGLCLP